MALASAVITRLRSQYRTKDTAALEEEARQRARQELDRKLQAVTCNLEDGPEGLRPGLPRQRRVAYVYHNLKAKVCKPFAA